MGDDPARSQCEKVRDGLAHEKRISSWMAFLQYPFRSVGLYLDGGNYHLKFQIARNGRVVTPDELQSIFPECRVSHLETRQVRLVPKEWDKLLKGERWPDVDVFKFQL